MRCTLDEGFRFPGGGLARRAVDGCMEVLAGSAEAPSREKVVDFCVCQVYALTFDAKMLRGWTPLIRSGGRLWSASLATPARTATGRIDG